MVFTRLEECGQQMRWGTHKQVPGMFRYKPHSAHTNLKDNSVSCFASSFSHNMVTVMLLHGCRHAWVCSAVFRRQLFLIRTYFSRYWTLICTQTLNTEAGWDWSVVQRSLFSAGIANVWCTIITTQFKYHAVFIPQVTPICLPGPKAF